MPESALSRGYKRSQACVDVESRRGGSMDEGGRRCRGSTVGRNTSSDRFAWRLGDPERSLPRAARSFWEPQAVIGGVQGKSTEHTQ